jgi:hypothetical protein
MRHQPTRKELRQRMSVTKQALIAADTQGMQVPDILALLSVDEPYLTRDTLAVWVADHKTMIQAVRGQRRTLPGGYLWYHRGVTPAARAPAPKTAVRSAPTQRAPSNRVIVITLPTLPRITRLRVYSLAVTLYAAALTALEVL